ncbi:MAG: ADP-forming succinate--CoA ligase subunit beta [Sphingomonadales bacterium]|nr:ADP-forming succinate--CoA ligase subunit beta [Sphingomonadales bacterium]
MNLHEYQGKALLSQFGVAIQQGIPVHTADDAVQAARQLQESTGTKCWVLKAQIHAGGRGKGGGVKVAQSLEEVREKAGKILGMQLVTPQTGPLGKKVYQILVAQDVYYGGTSPVQEFYMSVLLDRSLGKNIIVYSTEGGMDIEKVADERPDKIHKEVIDPSVGLMPFQARKIARNLGLQGQAFREMTRFVPALVNAYEQSDASLFEINPLFKTSDDRIIAVDAKVSIDENALYRHLDLEALRDIREEDPTEVEAGEHNLNYVKLDGNVGCMVNGAGLAMATMDIIQLSGGKPANFLDVGGTASAERVANAFRIIRKDPNVKAILVNIFGGIVRCDRVAQGIVDVCKQLGNMDIPLIVRLQGTNASEARALLDASGLPIQAVTGLHEAAEQVRACVA